jgi:NAD(P)-dependent dehydrogenase (short-subunit alcohol dehydrogenase family)/acyl carrier protein
LAEQLIVELSEDNEYPVVAYREGQRWVQSFVPLHLAERPESIPILRQSGVYLITGGLGSIGLALASHLACEVEARLVLVGRSRFPARGDWDKWLQTHDGDDQASKKIRRLQEIESMGSEVMVVSADVADPGQAQVAIEQACERFGTLHGVVHGAGNLAADAFFAIDQADQTLCERQFEAKVRGLIVLEQALRGKDLDFFVLLSSISSVLAGLGYVAYSAANNFLDAFARKYDSRRGVRWISIDWDTWQAGEPASTEAGFVELAMSSEEGVDALRRILASAPMPQVVVSTGDLSARMDRWINLRSLRRAQERSRTKSSRLHSRPVLVNPYIAPRDQLEQMIAEIWQDTLGVAKIGVFDNFFTDLSGSSLLATQVVSQLRSRFHAELPLRRFFDGPTVAELAATISSQHASGPQPLCAGDRMETITSC